MSLGLVSKAKTALVEDAYLVVSPIQLYLDLMALAGRGKDAAEEVFEKELRPLLEVGASKSGGGE